MQTSTHAAKKIAIIGSGISGLTTAYYLNKDHDITVFESNNYIGGHTDTHRIQCDNSDLQVDSGFIVFNERNYPNFVRLLKEINVEWQDSDMSFSVNNQRSGLQYSATDLRGLFSQKRNIANLKFYRMIYDIFRFYRHGPAIVSDPSYAHITLQDYLEQNKYSQSFMDDHLFPMTGALWSATPEKVKTFPVQYLVAFMQNHNMMQASNRPLWKVIKGGSQQYVKALTQSFRHKIVINSKIDKVERKAGKVILHGPNGNKQTFDKVIFACHSDQALRILCDPSKEERNVLGSIPYQENHMVLHSDTSVMPTKKSAWASWNAVVPNGASNQCTVTYYMNKLQNLPTKRPFFVTLNPLHDIDKRLVWQERVYHHPIYSIDTLKAQQQWHQISGHRNTFYCGAYWFWGFHEDGVRSALRVVDAIASEANEHVA